MKKLYRDGLSEDEAIRVAVEALYDAADDDSATGGPDLTRRIYPDRRGGERRAVIRGWTDADVGDVVQSVIDDRMSNPGG